MGHESDRAAGDEQALRDAIVAAARAMGPLGINQGKSGNVSVRCGDGLLVTPSGLDYDRMTADDIVRMEMDGTWAVRAPAGARLRPSSEWRIHRDVLRARPDAGAVVHAHPTYCVAIGIMRPEIPPLHYMIALAGGPNIRVAPYATFGTEALSALALAALEGRRACLLAHHGLVATGSDLAAALGLAVEVEALARQYHACLAIGEPPLLSARQIDEALTQFARGYGALPLATGADAG